MREKQAAKAAAKEAEAGEKKSYIIMREYTILISWEVTFMMSLLQEYTFSAGGAKK